VFIAAAVLAAAQTLPKSNQGYRVVGDSVSGASKLQSAEARNASKLAFESSDGRLVEAFQWARNQCLAFAFDDDPVGPWYEAAEPGREAFCMRDVAHQAMGGHAVGLARHNLNMLRRFAENISDSRDWCSFWEIDRQGRPAPVDYKDDAEFWYNLPANFDVLDACYRMYLWSGDRAYLSGPAFLNFYDRTVVDYVERWGLSLDQVMLRPRLLNIRGMIDAAKKFQSARGIPGYDEGNREYTIGVDVLATQYAAYLAYAYLSEARGNAERGSLFRSKAAAVRALVNTRWWNENGQHFYSRLGPDHNLEGRAASSLLYRDIIDDGPKLKSALRDAGRSAEVLYRYGDPDAATAQMLEVAFGPDARREYPEVPYSWIGALVNGTMGIGISAESPLRSAVAGFWVEAIVTTLPGLGSRIAWAELRNLPVRSNEIAVRHEGTRKTIFTNQRGPALIWEAFFPGSFETLLVNGRPMKARPGKLFLDRAVSSVRVVAGAGGTVCVEAPK
jgi:hypothetical protein